MTSRRDLMRSALAVAPLTMLSSASARSVTQWLRTLPPDTNADSIASNEDFWRTVQEAFAVDRTITNLNNGGVSPSPRSVQDALRRMTEETNRLPAKVLWQEMEPKQETVRLGLAAMFGVAPTEVAITRNASESLQNIQFGMTLQRGDEVLTTTHDYPRMLTTWDQRVRRDGIVLKKVPVPTPLKDTAALVRSIEEAITPRTKVIHVSHVVFLTGQIMPVGEICRMARRRGIPCIVDGAHSFAQFPFTRDELDCDFFGTSLHKWLCGPIGTGMLYIRKDRISDIWPLMAAPADMTSDIKKFEEIGTNPAPIHNALAEAIDFNVSLGLDRKAARYRYLHSIWIDRLKKYENVSFMTDIENPANQCALVLVHIDGTDPNKLTSWLYEKHRIFTVAIAHEDFKGLRIGPSIYTTRRDMERFADAMESVAKGTMKLD